MTSTSITTSNPVRSDLERGDRSVPADASRPRSAHRGWAVAGVVAALGSIAGSVASGFVGAVYDRDLVGDEAGILASLGDDVAPLVVFHVATSVAFLAMAVFALGLARRLRAVLPADSLLPGLAAFGLLGTSVVQVMGTSLDTEFIFGVADPAIQTASAAVMYNHWIGTVPWCLALTGLSALAVFGAARAGGVPRWLGRVGLVLGGLSILAAVLPVQYTAAATGGLWMLVTAIGFLAGDRTFRQAR